MKQERCYHFMKLSKLPTTAQVFPEAIPLIREAAANRTSSVSSLAAFLKEAAAIKANYKQPTASVPQISQKQLINMTRYRNILRYKLGLPIGRPIGQPLVAVPSPQPKHNLSSINLKIESFSLNNTHSVDLDASVVTNKSPRDQSKITAKRKTSSSASPKKQDNKAEQLQQPNRKQSKRTPIEPVFEDPDDYNEEHKLNSDRINQSNFLLIKDQGGGRRDLAMENFLKFSAPASGA